MYSVNLSRQAIKDLENLRRIGLAKKAKALIDILGINPYMNPPQYEKLVGDLQGYYSRRLNVKHRLVYQVLPNIEDLTDENDERYDGIVKVIRMWTHYE